MGDLGDWSDNHINPPEDKIIGYDWLGNELYGHEVGYIVNGEFISEDDIFEFMEGHYGSSTSGEVMR